MGTMRKEGDDYDPIVLCKILGFYDRWQLWLSQNRTTLLFIEGRTCPINFSINCTKSLFVLQPDLLLEPAEPSRAPF